MSSGRQRWSAEGAGARRLAQVLVQRSPSVLLRVIPPVVGVAFWLLRGEQRRRVTERLRRAPGGTDGLPPEARSLGTFVAFARSFAEGFAALSHRRDDVVLDVRGEQYLREAIARGKGCILLTAHTSSFEVAAAGLVHALGVPVIMAMRREPNAGGREVQDAVRQDAGLSIVHIDDDPLAALRLAEHLRAGAVVGLQIDRVPPGVRGISVRLLGQDTKLPLGPFALARATGCPVITVLTRRTGFLRAVVEAAPPRHLSKRATEGEMAAIAQEIADKLGAWISAAPAEWLDWGDR